MAKPRILQQLSYMSENLLNKNNDSGSNITLTNANITLTADPTTNMQAATKQYVDNTIIIALTADY